MPRRDVVDVHLSSQTERVDAFTDLPLLDGEKKYTVTCTEFVCPLAGQTALPPNSFYKTTSHEFFTIKRRNVGSAYTHNDTLLNTLPPPMEDVFSVDSVRFKKDKNRPIDNIGDMAYYMQVFFDDIKRKYTVNETQDQFDARTGPNAANGLLFVPNDHGGGALVHVAAAPFVKVQLSPNGCIQLFLHEFFVKHFFLEVSDYGQKVLGIPQFISYNRTGAGVFVEGLAGLRTSAVNNNIAASTVTDTVVVQGSYPLARFFDERLLLVLDCHSRTPPSFEWNEKNQQKLNHTIATFPITKKYKSSYSTNSTGTMLPGTSVICQSLVGDIVWRRAEDKVGEKYMVSDSSYFHNIRLEVMIQRREWNTTAKEFQVAEHQKLQLTDGESWSAKLRFMSTE